jgi:hypothetical protein
MKPRSSGVGAVSQRGPAAQKPGQRKAGYPLPGPGLPVGGLTVAPLREFASRPLVQFKGHRYSVVAPW